MTLTLTRRTSSARTCSLLGSLIVLPLMNFSSPSQASEVLHWKDAWVRSMPPAAQVTAAYGQLMNHGDEMVTITGITSTVGVEAQMHDVIAEGDGDFTVTLRHLPVEDDQVSKLPDLAETVAQDGFGGIPGDTDVQVSFSLAVSPVLE